MQRRPPVKSPNAILACLATILLAASVLGDQFTDDYNRSNAALNTNASVSIGANYQLVQSSGISWATNAVLTITNWQGATRTQSEFTQLLFGADGLTSGQLAQIQFAGYEQGSILVSGELAPIPEARIIWAALALAIFILWRELLRLARVTQNWRGWPLSSPRRDHEINAGYFNASPRPRDARETQIIMARKGSHLFSLPSNFGKNI
jgi:hypothetical protein